MSDHSPILQDSVSKHIVHQALYRIRDLDSLPKSRASCFTMEPCPSTKWESDMEADCRLRPCFDCESVFIAVLESRPRLTCIAADRRGTSVEFFLSKLWAKLEWSCQKLRPERSLMTNIHLVRIPVTFGESCMYLPSYFVHECSPTKHCDESKQIVGI